MFSFKWALAAIIVMMLGLASAPLALSSHISLGSVGALDGDDNDENDSDDEDEMDDEEELQSINGTVTAWIYDDDEDDDDEDEDDDMNETEKMRPEYFVIGNDTYVEFGPWWYWSVGTPNVTSVVHVGDRVNVTGEVEQEGNITMVSAWTIENLTTGEKLTIKEEGAPSWAGGPKAFGIDPWPPY